MTTTRFAPPSAGLHDDNKILGKDAARTGEDHSARIETLEHHVARLSLLAEALWLVLQEKTGLEASALNRYVETVVQERKTRSEHKLHCLVCNHASPASKPACIYCGGKLDGAVEMPVFPV